MIQIFSESQKVHQSKIYWFFDPNILRDALYLQFRDIKRIFITKSCQHSLKPVKTCPNLSHLLKPVTNQSRPRLGLARKLTDSHHKNGNTNYYQIKTCHLCLFISFIALTPRKWLVTNCYQRHYCGFCLSRILLYSS